MSDRKIKHLEFIQSTISRMNSNSFLLKGWAITLASALFALAAKDSNNRFILISYLVIPTFWMLDGFCLATERRYRDLYDKVRNQDEKEVSFDMDTSDFSHGNRCWARASFSKTLWPFYCVALSASLLITLFLQ